MIFRLGALVLSLLSIAGCAGAPAWKRASVGNLELEYRLRGHGEPVVFVHAGVFADWFEPLMDEPTLRDAYQSLTYHRAGYAGSSRAGDATIAAQAQQLGLLLRDLGLRRVHLVGQSSGALIAIQLALNAPETVRTLTLLEPALPIAGSPNAGIAASMALFKSGKREAAVDTFMRAVAGDNYRATVERTLPRAFDQALADADVFFEQELPAVRAWSFSRMEAQRLRMPVLIVLGARSDEVSPIWRQRHALLLSWLPSAEAFVLPGATHLLQLQNPRTLAEKLAPFFASHASR
jgi:pimeloyl-ACP methyl ester carboxylesterase